MAWSFAAWAAIAPGPARPEEQTAQAPRLLPSMALRGPYGSPLALGPPRALFGSPVVLGPVPAPDGSPLSEADAARARLPDERPAEAGRSAEAPTEEEDKARMLSGRVGRTPTKVPGAGRDGKTEFIAPHVTPDVEFALSRRASVGMFGEVGRVEVDTRSGLVPTVKARDLGAGLTLQYRFGQ